MPQTIHEIHIAIIEYAAASTRYHIVGQHCNWNNKDDLLRYARDVRDKQEEALIYAISQLPGRMPIDNFPD